MFIALIVGALVFSVGMRATHLATISDSPRTVEAAGRTALISATILFLLAIVVPNL